jgi:hypothetical protein
VYDARGHASIKEEIVLSQRGRDNLPDPAQYGLSRANTYFVVAMEFLLTPNNINVFARRGSGKTPIRQGGGSTGSPTFAFDGDEPIDFEDADSTRHFFFPKDYAHAVADSVNDFSNRISLRRYFYSDRGKHYMLVGVPCRRAHVEPWSWIDSAPAGTLIIDPSVSAAVNADVWLEALWNHDGHEAGLLIGKAAACCPKKRTLVKFDIAGAGIPGSATILNAQMKLYYYGKSNGGSGAWVYPVG